MIKVNCMSFCKMIKLMQDGTLTCKELAEETGLHVLTVYQYTKEMHKQGLVHIHMWEKDARGRDSIRIYMWGEGKDAKRKSMTKAERSAKYKDRYRKNKIMYSIAAAA